MFSSLALPAAVLFLIHLTLADKILLPRTTEIPPSILSELLTAIPPASLADFANPTSYAIISSQIAAGETPNWYAGLPTDVKAYFSSAGLATETGAVSAYRTSIFMTQSTTSADTTASHTSASSTSTSHNSASHTSATATSSPVPSSTSSLSTGAIVGIAAAAIVGIAIVTGLAIWYILERSKRPKALPIAEEAPAMGTFENTAYQGGAYQQYHNGPYQSVPNPAGAPVGFNQGAQSLYDPVKPGSAAVIESRAHEVYEVDGATGAKR